MTRLEFYVEKIRFLTLFIWWREWSLARDEWRMTYQQYMEALEHVDETEKKAIERLLKEMPDEEKEKERAN